MPLIILGLLLLISLLAYSIVRYINSGEEDTRPVRERYSKAFRSGQSASGSDNSDNNEDKSHDETIHASGYVDSDSLRGDIEYMARNLKDRVKENINDAAERHGIDLSKWGRDPYSHNPFDKDDRGGRVSPDESKGKEDNTVIFPTDNIEEEKSKRNIH